MISLLFLSIALAVALLLSFGAAWILRLRKHTRELEAVVIETRASEERYRTYIEHAPMGIFVARDDGGFALANPAISQMTGFTKDELFKMKLAELFSVGTPQESANFLESVHQHNSSEKEVTLRKKDGAAYSIGSDWQRLVVCKSILWAPC